MNNSFTAKHSAKAWRLLGIFALALIVRLVYNVYIAQHRILDIGDSFYYLSAGRSLAALVANSPSPAAFFSGLCAPAQTIPGTFDSFSSLALSDRLLIDGPIYPSYLATVFLLGGKALTTGALNVHQILFGVANSVVDAFLAVVVALLGEIAFGATAGILAGLGWCFYLPAVVNTQQCYGEPFVALILTTLLALVFYQGKKAPGPARPSFALSLLTGVFCGAIMLAKPAFVLMPPLIFFSFYAALRFSSYRKSFPFSLASLFLGLMLILTPWLLYTSTVSGAPKLVVNRAPGYNLYIGNYLPTDGWKTWPVVDGVPDSIDDAKRFIGSEAERSPGNLLSLLLRKFPRLWAGVWNDFHYSVSGFSYNLQNIFQALYLLLSCVGLAALLAGRLGDGKAAAKPKLRTSRPYAFSAAFTLAWVATFHCIYIFFEPVPRYAFTAMPLLITLAAAGLVVLGRSLLAVPRRERLRSVWQLSVLILLVGFLAAALYRYWTPVPLLIGLTQNADILRSLSALVLFSAFSLFALAFILVMRRLNLNGPISDLVIAKSFIFAGVIASASAISDKSYFEWAAEITPGQANFLKCNIDLRDLGGRQTQLVYLVVDAQAAHGAPEFTISANGDRETAALALPLYEYTAGGAGTDIPKLVNLQSRMMDVDGRSFRQWWVLPVDSKRLHYGDFNDVKLRVVQDRVKVFGDYTCDEYKLGTMKDANYIVWPSLDSFSWSKGFLTADNRDPRVYEEQFFRALGHPAELVEEVNGKVETRSFAGAPRVRVVIPMLGPFGNDRATIGDENRLAGILRRGDVLIDEPSERLISGVNPLSLVMAKTVTLTDSLKPGALLHMRARMRCDRPIVPATMAIGFEDASGKQFYNPLWQPGCLNLQKDWLDVDFATILPKSSNKWHTFTVRLLISPYPTDRLYLHRQEALKDKIFVKDLKLEILPPLLPGSRENGAFKLI